MSEQMRVHRSRKQIWRGLWLDIHCYLGLWVGACLAVLGLTGSILVFFQEIDAWLNPDLLTVTVPAGSEQTDNPAYLLDPRKIIQAAKQVAAPDSTLTSVYAPHTHQGVFAIDADQASGDWQRIFVDPHQATVTGIRSYSADEWFPDYLIDFIFQLHFSLLLGAPGITLMAVVALLLIISLITGLILWWPKTGQWHKALTIKGQSGAIRLTVDMHKTFAFYSCMIVGAALLSGVYMNLNDSFIWVTQQFSPATRGSPHQLVSLRSENAVPIEIDRAWAIAAKHFPDAELKSISAPEDATGVYVITQKNIPGLSPFWTERHIAIDQFSGGILDIRAPNARHSAGEAFLDWQWPLHSGNAFGWAGRMLIFIAGLACPVIYVTGVIRWLQKRKIPKASRNKAQLDSLSNEHIGKPQ